MRRTVGALLLALAFLSGARAQDELVGLWRLEGGWPGEALDALASIAPQSQAGVYTLQAVGRLGGQAVSWRARVERHGQELVVTHWQLPGGLSGALAGQAHGRYRLDAGGERFSGELTAPGQAGPARVEGRRQSAPRLRFDPERVELAPGERARVALQVEPSEVAPLLYVSGIGSGDVKVRRRGDRVELEALRAGEFTLGVALGRGGLALGALPVRVGADPAVGGDVLARVLARVLAAAAEPAGQPLVIFDLDDTLFDTRPRTRTILNRHGAEVGEPRLTALKDEQVRYALEDTLRQAGFSEAELEGEPGRAARRAWLRAFFDDTNLALDRPFPGAAAALQRLAQAGARIVYLTGRGAKAREASGEVLRAAGFPWEGHHLFLKPVPLPGQAKEPTAAFKERITRDELPALGRAVAAFDNEPGNCNAFRRALGPSGIVVFLDTLHEPDAPQLLPGTDTLQAWPQ